MTLKPKHKQMLGIFKKMEEEQISRMKEFRQASFERVKKNQDY